VTPRSCLRLLSGYAWLSRRGVAYAIIRANSPPCAYAGRNNVQDVAYDILTTMTDVTALAVMEGGALVGLVTGEDLGRVAPRPPSLCPAPVCAPQDYAPA